ncbi:MYB1 [Hepatospora eriocheir]|uniref:MYB1 n=1 Tax=Hepatospora eriocheir TaxID=1081669 RepID=A0A1X0QAF4_9MICR|nr:MYB1 [Hepatospora eriocheir]
MVRDLFKSESVINNKDSDLKSDKVIQKKDNECINTSKFDESKKDLSKVNEDNTIQNTEPIICQYQIKTNNILTGIEHLNSYFNIFNHSQSFINNQSYNFYQDLIFDNNTLNNNRNNNNSEHITHLYNEDLSNNDHISFDYITNQYILEEHRRIISKSHCNKKNKGRSSKKVKWTREEDKRLLLLIKNYGTYDWDIIDKCMLRKTKKQCQDRYNNDLNPSLNQAPFTQKEKIKIIKLKYKFGDKWKCIAKGLKNRSENAIKNFYYEFLKTGNINN